MSFQKSNNAIDGSPMFSSDVETFNGKIVYNLDGSAFIIDAGSANLSSSSATPTTTASTPTPIATALTSETKASTYQKGVDKFHKSIENKGRVQGHSQSQSQSVAEAEAFVSAESWRSSPRVHSFRVVSAQDASTHCQDPSNAASPMHKNKPILMCFICKLSFGNVNSFSLHANTEHRLNLKELEQQLLKREYSSAIIQRNMDEEPQISFLQPLDINADDGGGGGGGGAALNNIGTASELLEPPIDGDKECTSATTSQHPHPHPHPHLSLYHNPNDNDDVDEEANNKSNAEATSLELEEHTAVKFSSLNSAIAKTTNINPLKTTATEGAATATTTTKPAISSASASTSTSTSASPLPKPVNPLENVEGTPASAAPTPEPPSMCEESQVDAPTEGHKATSTDNISNDKSSNKQRNKDADSKLTYSSSLKKVGDQMNRSPNVAPSASTTSSSSDSSQPLHIADSDAALTAAEILQKHFLLLQQQQQVAAAGEFAPIQAQTQAQLSSFQASLAALANEQNSRGVKLLTEFLQLHHHQNQLNLQSFPTSCPEHADFKGVDCKTCELIDIQHRMKSPATPQSQSQSQQQPQPQRSPNTNSSGLSTSMPISPSASSAASVGNATASSFTIGACSDHISGRPQGVDCAR